MVRYFRMKGRPTLWLPGTDHAGIATQVCHLTNWTCYYIFFLPETWVIINSLIFYWIALLCSAACLEFNILSWFSVVACTMYFLLYYLSPLYLRNQPAKTSNFYLNYPLRTTFARRSFSQSLFGSSFFGYLSSQRIALQSYSTLFSTS